MGGAAAVGGRAELLSMSLLGVCGRWVGVGFGKVAVADMVGIADGMRRMVDLSLAVEGERQLKTACQRSW